MPDLYSTEKLFEEFSNKFKNIPISHNSVPLGGGNVHAFFITMNEQVLKDNWRPISNFLAISFQSKLQTEFERWNVYLFFKTENAISNELKYLVENDTFSSRKIVVDEQGKNKLTDADIIGQHITNTDLGNIIAENATVQPTEEFKKDELLNSLLTNYQDLKKNTEDYFPKLLSDLESKLS